MSQSASRYRTRRERAPLARRRVRIALLALLVCAGVAAAVVVWRAGSAGTSRAILLRIAGGEVRVPRGTTLGQAAGLLGLEPRAGDLLDVDGVVLRRGVFPGLLLLNGRRSPPATTLHAGDRLGVRGGRDRVEPTRRRVSRTALDRLESPQFFLDLVPGRILVVRGALSHKLVSARFLPEGPPFPARAVALTFDDGPSRYTGPLLVLLRRLHVPATFFVIGRQALADPGLVRAELAAGMTVANHSFDHPNRPAFARLPLPRIRAEIEHGQAALASLGVHGYLFRPPGGSISPAVLRAAATSGLRIVLWSVDARDWVPGTSAAQVARRVLDTVRAGSIVELHDGGGDRTATLKALPTIVAGIRSRGLRLIALAAG